MTFFKWINDQYFLCGWASRRWDEAWIIVGDMLTQRMESVSQFFYILSKRISPNFTAYHHYSAVLVNPKLFLMLDVARVSYKWFSVELSKQAVWTIVGSR